MYIITRLSLKYFAFLGQLSEITNNWTLFNLVVFNLNPNSHDVFYILKQNTLVREGAPLFDFGSHWNRSKKCTKIWVSLFHLDSLFRKLGSSDFPGPLKINHTADIPKILGEQRERTNLSLQTIRKIVKNKFQIVLRR